jgi:hypothetical protein
VSPRDKLISFRREELAKLKGVVAQKDRNKAYERASDRIREEREEWSDVSRAIVKKKCVSISLPGMTGRTGSRDGSWLE